MFNSRMMNCKTAQSASLSRSDWYPAPMDPISLERAKQPDLRVGRGHLAARARGLTGTYTLVSQPEPLAHVDAAVVQRRDDHGDGRVARRGASWNAAAAMTSSDHIVGIGGGVVMDTAKYLAWRDGDATRARPQHHQRGCVGDQHDRRSPQ